MLIHLFPQPSQPQKAILRIGSMLVPCAIGKSGTTARKREGDGATPRGILRPVMIYFRPDQKRPTRLALPAKPIRRDRGWCDDPASPRYNREITLPDRCSHEVLWRDDRLYDIVIETDWNRRPAKRGRGSAIFIHYGRPGRTPTEGCIALDPKGMKLFLSVLRKSTRLFIH
jgi:L,D-peptidoglycan transpeptidase YkuD (ErfK/YbiS/YcfS/YnhG family)